MTDRTCERCKYASQYPFLDPCFQCTHHKNFEPADDGNKTNNKPDCRRFG